jgi:hypothetical protein
LPAASVAVTTTYASLAFGSPVIVNDVPVTGEVFALT